MNGLIIFNSANDVVFQLFNGQLAAKIREIAMAQFGTTSPIDGNIILQIFSPVINSQRIMHCQFDNTYASFQCENGLNFAFGELLGCSFVKIGQRPVEQLKRQLGVAIAFVRHFYGANLFATQASVQEELLSGCLDCYEQLLLDEDQAMLLEALPQLVINAELKRVVRTTLDASLERLRELGHQRTHTLLFVAHNFVGVASTKLALAMSASDLLFVALLTRSLQREAKKPLSRSVAIFLQGASQDPNSGCVPCIAHLAQLEKGVVLIQIIEYANLQVASSMYDTFFVLQKIVSVQMQGDSDALKPAYESLEAFVKQTLDALKRAKLKGDELDSSLKKCAAKWENLRKMYAEFLKSFERELLVRIESNIPSFIEDLKLLFTLSCCDSSAVALDQLPEVASMVEGRLLEFCEFLAVKAERNISIEAYLEDFPGLVHFVFVNRSSGLMIAPDLRSNQLVPKERLWLNMVEFTRSYLKKGQSTVMWKDRTFNYCYFLWFEDQSSGVLKSVDLQHFVAAGSASSAFKPQFEPGLLAADYYQQLAEVCFPKVAPCKIKCYELFCIHLGLVTATCAVEHARRLVATIADVVGENSF